MGDKRDKKNAQHGFTGTNLAITITATQKIIGFVFQDTIKKVHKGSEFYLGERFYSITKDQYLMDITNPA